MDKSGFLLTKKGEGGPGSSGDIGTTYHSKFVSWWESLTTEQRNRLASDLVQDAERRNIPAPFIPNNLPDSVESRDNMEHWMRRYATSDSHPLSWGHVRDMANHNTRLSTLDWIFQMGRPSDSNGGDGGDGGD